MTFFECINVKEVRFFLDQDSGVRAACLSAFKDEVLGAPAMRSLFISTRTLTSTKN